jgi:hypothetical protein
VIGHEAAGIDVEEMRGTRRTENGEQSGYKRGTREEFSVLARAKGQKVGALTEIGFGRKAIGFSTEFGHVGCGDCTTEVDERRREEGERRQGEDGEANSPLQGQA